MSTDTKATGEPSAPTHAGGVVHRIDPRGAIELLLVTARGRADEWVLPKGHVDPGESPEVAAVRELEEEAGVLARIVGVLGDVDVELPRERARIRYFAMELDRDGSPGEGRAARWCPPDEAVELLRHPEAKAMARLAASRLARRDGSR